jgi:hypothetical protein
MLCNALGSTPQISACKVPIKYMHHDIRSYKRFGNAGAEDNGIEHGALEFIIVHEAAVKRMMILEIM